MFEEIRKSTTGALDKAKLMVFQRDAGAAVEDEEQTSPQQQRLEELAEYCPQLTFQQRLIGFAVCFSLGCTCSTNAIVMDRDWLRHGCCAKEQGLWLLHMSCSRNKSEAINDSTNCSFLSLFQI
jgi:uncharacterized metal-binding protein